MRKSYLLKKYTLEFLNHATLHSMMYMPNGSILNTVWKWIFAGLGQI
jgi:hypothetical protein